MLKYTILILSALLFSCVKKHTKDNNASKETVKAEALELNRPPDNIKFEITASSELIGKNEGQYSPFNAFDNDPNTAWVEGSGGNGEGEWIEITFQKTQLIKEMIIRNGYQKSKSTYEENNRMSSFSLYIDGKKTFIHSSGSIGKFGRFKLNQFAKKIRIQIETVEKGTQYNDLCISDIEFEFEDETLQREIKQKIKSNKNDKQVIISLDKDSKRIYMLDQKLSFHDINLISSVTKSTPLFNPNTLIDFQAEKLKSLKSSFPFYVIRIHLQYNYDLDTYLHFVPKDHFVSEKIIFHLSWDGVDGSFEYPEWEVVNLDGDAYDDIHFKAGECFNTCEDFKNEVRAITEKTNNNEFTLEFEQ